MRWRQAFDFPVNLTQYGEVEDRYVKILQPTLYRHEKTGARGYGLKFWPKTVDQLLPDHPHLEFIRSGQK